MSFQNTSHLQCSLALSHMSIPEACVEDLACARRRGRCGEWDRAAPCSCNGRAAGQVVTDTTTQTITRLG